MGYYDIVLAGIITSITLGFLAASITPASFQAATGTGVLAATLFMYHGLFHRTPTNTSP